MSWAGLYLEAIGELVTDPAVAARLDADLVEGFRLARDACPGCEVDEAAFVRHIARHVGRQALEPGWMTGLRLDHLLIAFASVRGCSTAMKLLRAKVQPVIVAAARKVDDAPAFVDDVTQHVFEKLLVAKDGKEPRLLSYAGKGVIEAWVRISAARTAIDLVRQRRGDVGSSDDDMIEGIGASAVDPELVYIRAHYAKEVTEALRSAFGALTPRERTILRLHLLDGLNIDRIGVLYSVHRATVARWIAHARERVLLESHRALQDRLGATDSEAASLERLVRSDLRVCLSEWLATSAEARSKTGKPE